MRTNGGFTAQCTECGTTEVFPTQLQRQKWIHKRHIGHTLYLWREVKA